MFVKNFGKWYNARLDATPMLTKCTTAAVISVFGDAMSQVLESSKYQ